MEALSTSEDRDWWVTCGDEEWCWTTSVELGLSTGNCGNWRKTEGLASEAGETGVTLWVGWVCGTVVEGPEWVGGACGLSVACGDELWANTGAGPACGLSVACGDELWANTGAGPAWEGERSASHDDDFGGSVLLFLGGICLSLQEAVGSVLIRERMVGLNDTLSGDWPNCIALLGTCDWGLMARPVGWVGQLILLLS